MTQQRSCFRSMLIAFIAVIGLGLSGILLFNSSIDSPQHAPVIRLTHGGKVRGKIVDADEPDQVYMYEGFPYGTAKRFQRPEMHAGWKGTWDATFPRDACPFVGLNASGKGYTTQTYSDDCHYMTIWKPTEPSEILRPVMVYIYGGAFVTGSVFKTNHDGRYIAARGDVIVIGFNYRTGEFGFLYSGDDTSGNLGLWDQALALQWVKENIVHFGGNPNSITVFGNSAGAQSIALHMHSPVQSQKLFQRAIFQSGASIILLHKEDALNRTQTLSQHLNCTIEDSQDMIQCLQDRPIDDILRTATNQNLKFKPVLGDDFFSVSFADSVNQSYFNRDVDIMFGVSSDEGSGFILSILPELYPENINLTLAEAIADIPKVLNFFQLDTLELIKSTTEYYTRNFTNKTSSNELRDMLAKLRGDLEMVCPEVLVVERFARLAPTKKYHMYQLNQRAKREGSLCVQQWMGVCHADELFYLFLIPEQYTEADRKVSQVMIRAWSSFAWFGSPGYAAESYWEEAFDREPSSGLFGLNISAKYMKLQHQNYTMMPAGHYRSCEEFWVDHIAY